MVRIYAQGEMIAIHERNYTMGGYSTIKEHLCSHHQHYLDRSPKYYMDKAGSKSPDLHKVVTLLFEGGRPPEQNYRTCDGLFNLHRKTDPIVFAKACQEAISCKCYSYKFIMKVIENYKSQPNQQVDKPLPEHSNIRGKEYYKQLTINNF
jgi:hypothetical protein